MFKLPLLEIRNLHLQFKIYDGLLKVLDGINLKVFPKEKIGLVGEAGCGKTTTVKSILKIVPTPPAIISKGEILYKNKDILRMTRRELNNIRKKNISMVFQYPLSSLNPVFSIGHQLQKVMKFTKNSNELERLNKKEIYTKALKLLSEVMLPDPERILRSYPIQLSGGMCQRVCIANAIASNPELLIADEPGTALDVTIKDQILALLEKIVIEKSASIILISHSLGSVRNITDRLYVMYAGSIVEVNNTKKLFAEPLHPYTKALIKSAPKLTGEKMSTGIPGSIPNYLNPPTGCRFHPRCKYKLPMCEDKKPPLFTVDENHQVACWLFSRREK